MQPPAATRLPRRFPRNLASCPESYRNFFSETAQTMSKNLQLQLQLQLQLATQLATVNFQLATT
jgi:hypothetical protein